MTTMRRRASAFAIVGAACLCASAHAAPARSTLPFARAATRVDGQRCYAPIALGEPPADCAASAAPRQAWISPDAKRGGIIYVSLFAQNEVQLFSMRGPEYRPLGVLTGLHSPQGITVDRKGNLYVADTNASNVLVFPRGSTTPSRVLADPNEGPADVAVAPDGTVYVSNETNASGTGGSVSIYPPGANKPSRTLTNPAFNFVIGVCLDPALNLYVSFNKPSGNGAVYELTKHGSKWVATDTGISVTFAGMPAVDDAGHIVEPDQGQSSQLGQVNVYGPGPVLLYAFAGPDFPLTVALREGEKRAYVSQPKDGTAQVWSYPGPTVKLIGTIQTAPTGGTSTLAVDPSDDL